MCTLALRNGCRAGRDEGDGRRNFDVRAARVDDRMRRRDKLEADPEIKKMGFRSIFDVAAE